MIRCPICDEVCGEWLSFALHLCYVHNWFTAFRSPACPCGQIFNSCSGLACHLERHALATRESLEYHLVVEALKRQPNLGGFA